MRTAPHSHLISRSNLVYKCCILQVFASHGYLQDAVCKDAHIVAYITHATSPRICFFIHTSGRIRHQMLRRHDQRHKPHSPVPTFCLLNDDAPTSTRARLMHTHSLSHMFTSSPYDIKTAPHSINSLQLKSHIKNKHSPSPHFLFSPRWNLSH